MDDPQAFEQLVVRYQGVVCAVAYAVLRDRGRSEEIAQEAFLIAWQKLPSMDPPPVLPAWVCGIARNLAANARRRRKESPMDHVTEPAAASTPLDHVLDHERVDLANQALAHLSETDREAVVLYYRGDGSIAEVAATLGITEPAARQRLHRGRERLANALASVEAALRSTRPGPAFTAACVTAALTYRATDASAAAVTRASKAKRFAPIAGGIVAVAALSTFGVVAATRSSGSSSGSQLAVAESAPVVASIDAAPKKTRDAGIVIKHIDGSRRTALRDTIRTARVASDGRATGGADTGTTKVYDFSEDTLGPSAPPLQVPTTKNLDKRNLRVAVREIHPLLLECHDAARNRLPSGGTLAVKLTIIGEPEVGTLVESVELGGPLSDDKDFAECMRETLFSIELPPMPAANETWTVHYPLTMPKS